jgi:hypothetical protein
VLDVVALPTAGSADISAALRRLPVIPVPVLGETIAFDGFDASTWAYSNGGWTNVTPMDSPSPPARAYAGLAYDADAKELVLFGGMSISGTGMLNDTWVFRGGAWANVTSPSDPPPNSFFGLATDAPDNGVLLYGGYATNNSTDGASRSTWLFGGTGWRDISGPLASAPPGAIGPGLAYDSVNRQVVLFGGIDLYHGVYN